MVNFNLSSKVFFISYICFIFFKNLSLFSDNINVFKHVMWLIILN